MNKPKLFLYLAILALLTWFVDILGIGLAILILSHNELKYRLVDFYTQDEIKYLKIAKRLSIVSIIIFLLFKLVTIYIVIFILIAYFSH